MSDGDDWIGNYELPPADFPTDIFSLQQDPETRNVPPLQYVAHQRAPQTQPLLPLQPPPQAQRQPYVKSPARPGPHSESFAYVPALQNPGVGPPHTQRVAWGNGQQGPMPNPQRQSGKLTPTSGPPRHIRTGGVNGRVAATQSNNKLTALQLQVVSLKDLVEKLGAKTEQLAMKTEQLEAQKEQMRQQISELEQAEKIRNERMDSWGINICGALEQVKRHEEILADS